VGGFRQQIADQQIADKRANPQIPDLCYLIILMALVMALVAGVD
jgi:hypothetical protein